MIQSSSSGIKFIFTKLAVFILSTSGSVRQLLVISIDFLLCFVSFWSSFVLRTGETRIDYSPTFSVEVLAFSVLALALLIRSGIYNNFFRYAGGYTFFTLLKSVVIYGVATSIFISVIGIEGIPKTLGILQPLVLFFLLAVNRFFMRFLVNFLQKYASKKIVPSKNGIIYGSGITARAIGNFYVERGLPLVGYIDDIESRRGRVIEGMRIYSKTEVRDLIRTHDVDFCIIAKSKLYGESLKKIIEYFKDLGLEVRVAPPLEDSILGSSTVSRLEILDFPMLVGRELVRPEKTKAFNSIFGKTVLVSGAGGSIGRELCSEICELKPSRLVLLESNEYALFSILKDLKAVVNESSVQLIPILASVQDERQTSSIIEFCAPDIVFHSAAYKHVGLVEGNIFEGVKNNVLGTDILLRASVKYGVSKFVLVSTDKAVRPTNIMGATKRVAELIALRLAATETTKTVVSIVRFGNVVNSSGSVIPIFKSQIAAGGPVTVTHPDATRFFMSINEAANLVLYASAIARNGCIFLLDMGERVRIKDLAENMIKLSGYKVGADKENNEIDIIYTGLQPSEKLHEEFLLDGELMATEHPKIFKANEPSVMSVDIEKIVGRLSRAVDEFDEIAVKQMLASIVEGYVGSDELSDHISKLRESKTNAQINTAG